MFQIYCIVHQVPGQLANMPMTNSLTLQFADIPNRRQVKVAESQVADTPTRWWANSPNLSTKSFLCTVQWSKW